jgi:hypothetical protein
MAKFRVDLIGHETCLALCDICKLYFQIAVSQATRLKKEIDKRFYDNERAWKVRI